MTKSQLEARVQTLSEVLEALDPVYFEHLTRKPELAPRPRRALYNSLAAARKALAEAPDESSPYAPSEDYLNALRSFGLTNEQCVEELRSARANDFELRLTDEVRKAYDQGRADGYEKGYEVGWCLGSSRP